MLCFANSIPFRYSSSAEFLYCSRYLLCKIPNSLKFPKSQQTTLGFTSMATQLIAPHRENAEIYQGEDLCKQKSRELLDEISLPKGLLPLNDIVEVGYNRSTGFVWFKQKKRTEHRFQAIRRTVSYESEVTAFVEKRRMRRVSGVKSKELFFWVTVSDIFIDDPDSDKITFANSTGISRSFPVSAFQLNEEDEK